jgi:hypothetical protein
VVTDKWIFRHKIKVDGTLDQYKARWVLRGFTQRHRVDYDETFSPVIKPATVRTYMMWNWAVLQLDVKNVFLHDTLTEMVYYNQLVGFVDSTRPGMVCK